MNNDNNVPFGLCGTKTEAAPVSKLDQLGRIPRGFREAMEYISMQKAGSSNHNPANVSAEAPRRGVKPTPKWKSSFTPLDGEEDSSQVNSASSPQQEVELYDPYNPASPGSDRETPHHPEERCSHSNQEGERLFPHRNPHDRHHWVSPYPEPPRSHVDRRDLSPKEGPCDSRGVSLTSSRADRRSYSPDTEDYRLLDHRLSSPERHVGDSSIQRFPASYGAQSTNGDEMRTFKEYRREIPTGREAMEYISMQKARSLNHNPANVSAEAPRRGVKPAFQWESSFTPLDGEEDSSQVNSASSPQQEVELYDPYNPASPGSDRKTPHHPEERCSHSNQEGERLFPHRNPHDRHHWVSPYPEPPRSHVDRRDLSPKEGPCDSRGVSLTSSRADRRSYSPDTEDYRLLDHRLGSPERHVGDSSIQRFPASYGAQSTNGDEMRTFPEYGREIPTMAATGRLCTSSLQMDYQPQMKIAKRGLDEIPPSTERYTNRRRIILMDENPIRCELCFVEVANGQELQDHFESKTHWDTLEHIQREKDYDDVSIAFLQEVLLHKSRHRGRAIEDRALKVLQKNDHMTKIEIFHCAACDIFVTTSASSVETHIMSQEHLCNAKAFGARQRDVCLDKAETMMMDLKPQFEQFLKGGNLFE
ncbi:uncharacterized protein [Antennarius striatus]|uniref:uncharacterized protein n=1 Tax=Antennarius striatus TaxID=241820 RepID=UPI0035AE22FF